MSMSFAIGNTNTVHFCLKNTNVLG